MRSWSYGETVIVRNIARSDGTVTTAIPTIVIRDTQEVLALYIPRDTPYQNNWVVLPEQRIASVDAITPSAQRQYRELITRNDSLRLYLPNRGYSIGLTFDRGGKFESWYGNLEAPFVRTALGIDTRDFALDVIAYPDGRWHWKDEEEFNRRLELGVDSAQHHHQVRVAGLDFIDRFEHHTWPFNEGWEYWQPEENWKPGSLPENWAIDLGSRDLLPPFD